MSEFPITTPYGRNGEFIHEGLPVLLVVQERSVHAVSRVESGSNFRNDLRIRLLALQETTVTPNHLGRPVFGDPLEGRICVYDRVVGLEGIRDENALSDGGKSL